MGSRAITDDTLAGRAPDCARGDSANAQVVKVELSNDLDARFTGLDAVGQASPFDRIDWYQRTIEHSPPSGEPLVARACQGNACTYLFLSRLGRRATGLASWYTLAYRPAFTGGCDARRHDQLAAIARALRGSVGRIVLDHVPADTAVQIDAAFGRPWLVRSTPQVASWTADVRGQSFDIYWAARPGRLRSTYKRKIKAGLDLQVLTRFDADAWAAYEAIYAQSWKPEEGSMLFLRAYAQAESAAGRLRFGIARHDGEAIAAQFWSVDHGVAYIHKLAHREQSVALSPGTLLSHALFKHVINVDRVDTIDFGTGDDAYKADWMTTRAMLHHVELFDLASIDGLAGAGHAMAARLVARWRSR